MRHLLDLRSFRPERGQEKALARCPPATLTVWPVECACSFRVRMREPPWPTAQDLRVKLRETTAITMGLECLALPAGPAKPSLKRMSCHQEPSSPASHPGRLLWAQQTPKLLPSFRETPAPVRIAQGRAACSPDPIHLIPHTPSTPTAHIFAQPARPTCTGSSWPICTVQTWAHISDSGM